MLSERTRMLRPVHLNLSSRVRHLESTVDQLRSDVEALQQSVEWSNDPAESRARRSTLVMVTGSVGWWSGAIGFSETLKLAASNYLTGNDLVVFGLGAWVLGCAVVAGQSERITKNLTVKLAKKRYQQATNQSSAKSSLPNYSRI